MAWPWEHSGPLPEQAELAWRSAVAAAVLIVLAQGGFLLLTVNLYGWSLTPIVRTAHIALSIAVLITLLLSSPARQGLGLAAFYLLVAAALPTLWLADSQRLAMGTLFAPLSAYKFSLLALAIMAPGPPSLGLVWLGIYTAQAFLQVAITDYGGLLQGTGEPWTTATYALAGAVVVLYRAHHRQVANRAAQAAAEASALTELTHFMLAARDLYNTPIQNLEIDTALLERNHPPSPQAVRRMRNAVRQLRELRTLLTRYDHLAAWDPEQHALDSERAQRWLDRLEAGARLRERGR